MIPTRCRVPRLLKTIESIRNTSQSDRVEILLRTDTDDLETAGALPDLISKYAGVRVLCGPRLNAYESLNEFYNELARISEAQWVVVLNDDITLEGAGWDEQLSRLHVGDSLAWGQYYHLGLSWYRHSGAAFVCPFVPTSTWLQHGPAHNPVDWWWREQSRKNHWKIHRLAGLTIHHDRDNDEQLAVHRAI